MEMIFKVEMPTESSLAIAFGDTAATGTNCDLLLFQSDINGQA